ncbi:MAG: hypothetical protein KKH98_10045 [Spirochaetes bacterium]|nr:hypothetical protein [Spirochaetota bacterium]
MTEPEKNTPLGQLLIQADKITEDQLLKALEEQRNTGHRLGHTLIKLGYIDENVLIEVLEKQFGIPAVKINKKMLNPIMIKRTLPETICRKYRLIPIMIENNSLTIAASDPYDLSFKEEIKFTTDHNIEIVLSPENSVLEAINHVFGVKKYDWEDQDVKGTQAGSNVSNVSAAKTFDMILQQAYNMKATELQLEHFEETFNVLFITPTNVIRSKPLPNYFYKPISLRIRQLSSLDLNITTFQEGIMNMEIGKKNHTLRVLIFPTKLGENIIIKFS